MNSTAIKYILISVKTIDTILTFALFYCEWKDINDDDGIIHGMVMASIISRAVLNSCVFKPNTNYALKYFGQALQCVPIGLLIAAIVICIIRNRYVSTTYVNCRGNFPYQFNRLTSLKYFEFCFSISLNVYFAIGVVIIWIITDLIMLFITLHEKRVEQQNEIPEVPC